MGIRRLTLASNRDLSSSRWVNGKGCRITNCRRNWFTRRTRSGRWPVMRNRPEGESMAEVITRVGAAMERLAEEHAGREVVIVSHGGAIRGAIAHALADRAGQRTAHVDLELIAEPLAADAGRVAGSLRERTAGVLKAPLAPHWLKSQPARFPSGGSLEHLCPPNG